MRQVEVLNCVASTDELKVERDNLKAELADHKQQLQAIRRALDETRHSNSWKITAPLRKLATFWQGAKTRVRRPLKWSKVEAVRSRPTARAMLPG